ncbi:MAG TPA: FAD-dependent oxidoreductase [Sporichthya sp.]|jgi:predicted NAD/FAD-binding protein|nr:FAD-dependent oxidoreductase [Sporichthya sp.]
MTTTPARPRRRIAVVGGGVSGLTAAWVLQRSADVTLYEADERLGGHAHTHDVPRSSGGTVAIDTGFIVHNEKTYPTLLRLFATLGVATQASDMSMSVRCEGCGLEYAGARGLRGLFPGAGNTRPAYLRMLLEVPRFHRAARALLEQPPAPTGAHEETLGEFVARGRYSAYFVDHFVKPVVACVWSCSPETALAYPARYLFAFLSHHGMLRVTGSPPWRTVTGGSRSYVEKVAKDLHAVHTATPVRSLARSAAGVEIRDDADQVGRFDAVVVATHPHQALALLAAPTALETSVLGAIGYATNSTVLHTDTTPLPRTAGAQASWNYRMSSCSASTESVVVSYDMNRLMALPGPERYVVSLNSPDLIDPAKVIARMVYEHPIYTPTSVAAQRRLPELNDDRVAFAGAYHGWGFHEDGALSGLTAARALGGAW